MTIAFQIVCRTISVYIYNYDVKSNRFTAYCIGIKILYNLQTVYIMYACSASAVRVVLSLQPRA